MGKRYAAIAFLTLLPIMTETTLSETAPAPAISGFDWTGAYVGLHAGATWGANTATHTGTPASLFATSEPPLPTSSSVGGYGFVGGAQWGVNYQIGSAVVGVESDISWSNRSKSDATSGVLSDGRPFTYTAGQALTSFGTLRTRIGFVPAERFLAYGTAGVAYGRANSTTVFNITGAPARIYQALNSGTRVGWIAGVGGEYAFDNTWSGKLEYLYYDLGGATSIGLPVPSNNGVQTHSHFGLTGQLARFGINYRPDWSRPILLPRRHCPYPRRHS